MKTRQKPGKKRGRDPKNDHGRFLLKALSDLRPALENDLLYRPVCADDPDIRALAASTEKFGLQEPIVITEDDTILSGHRRRIACQLAGLIRVHCRVHPIRSTDPDFLNILREHNLQRIKNFSEIAREEILSADPEESFRVLVEHRERQAQLAVESFAIEGVKRRSPISSAKEPFLRAVLEVIRARENYWPLTDRQIHYALLNDPPLMHARKPASVYRNDAKSYRNLTDLLARARIVGRIPWNVIHDPTRPVVTWKTHREVSTFIRAEMADFLKGYYRDLMQSQPNHIEIVGEKNTIGNIIRPVAMQYRIPMTLGRGYSSLSPRRDMAIRFQKSGKEKLVILFLADFDPEGLDIPLSFARSLRDDLGVDNIKPIRVALTDEQVAEMRLPPRMKAKDKGARYQGFVDKFGDDVFELEAVEPQTLQEILRIAIDNVIDCELFNREIDAEKRDAAHLSGLRETLKKMMPSLATDPARNGE